MGRKPPVRVVYFGLGQLFAGDTRLARIAISWWAIEPVWVAGVLLVERLRFLLGVEVRAVVVAVGGQRRHAGRTWGRARAAARAAARACRGRRHCTGEEGVLLGAELV